MTKHRRGMQIGWFTSLPGLIGGAVVGVLFCLASVIAVYVAEGRAHLGDLARTARVADERRVDASLDGTLVSVTSRVATDAAVTDPEFLRGDAWLWLARHVEMYAWVEQQKSGRAGFTYSRAWTQSPADSARFHDPRGHENPPMRVRAARWTASRADVGAYRFAPEEASLPGGHPVQLTPERVREDAPYDARLDGGYLYIGEHRVGAPDVGDLRIQFRAYPAGDLGTVFARQQGASLRPFTDGRSSLYRLLPGTREQALGALDREHRTLTWVVRVIGFVLFWLGLNLAAAPVSAMFAIVPVLGRATRSMLALATLPASLAVIAATVVLAHATAHPLLALGVIALIWLIAFVQRRRRAQ